MSDRATGGSGESHRLSIHAAFRGFIALRTYKYAYLQNYLTYFASSRILLAALHPALRHYRQMLGRPSRPAQTAPHRARVAPLHD
jgi:hypothetical protein